MSGWGGAGGGERVKETNSLSPDISDRLTLYFSVRKDILYNIGFYKTNKKIIRINK